MSSNTTVVVAEKGKRGKKKEVCDPKPADVPENNVVESCVKQTARRLLKNEEESRKAEKY
jgi:hypothetical protein